MEDCLARLARRQPYANLHTHTHTYIHLAQISCNWLMDGLSLSVFLLCLFFVCSFSICWGFSSVLVNLNCIFINCGVSAGDLLICETTKTIKIHQKSVRFDEISVQLLVDYGKTTFDRRRGSPHRRPLHSSAATLVVELKLPLNFWRKNK